uniref:Uncharacterized protein n=1 Tax=Arundo donax TaxID=35708 RepID=A0A0A9GFX2_ARUDO
MTGLNLLPLFSTQLLFFQGNIGMFWMLFVYCKRTPLFRKWLCPCHVIRLYGMLS